LIGTDLHARSGHRRGFGVEFREHRMLPHGRIDDVLLDAVG
jgi:hypothetical protein